MPYRGSSGKLPAIYLVGTSRKSAQHPVAHDVKEVLTSQNGIVNLKSKDLTPRTSGC